MVSLVAQKIKSKMTEQRFTVASLEREAGLKVHAVRNILLGKSKNPSADTLKAISNVLGCTVDDLLNTENETSQAPNKKHDAAIEIRNPDLFRNVVQGILEVFKEHKKTPTYKDLSFMVLEVYQYSVENNNEEADKSFMTWLYSRNF